MNFLYINDFRISIHSLGWQTNRRRRNTKPETRPLRIVFAAEINPEALLRPSRFVLFGLYKGEARLLHSTYLPPTIEQKEDDQVRYEN